LEITALLRRESAPGDLFLSMPYSIGKALSGIVRGQIAVEENLWTLHFMS
jgi:hypothetical protein